MICLTNICICIYFTERYRKQFILVRLEIRNWFRCKFSIFTPSKYVKIPLLFAGKFNHTLVHNRFHDLIFGTGGIATGRIFWHIYTPMSESMAGACCLPIWCRVRARPRPSRGSRSRTRRAFHSIVMVALVATIHDFFGRGRLIG